MCPLKDVGFGWTDPGPHPVPCTCSWRREDSASVSLGCPSSYGYRGVTAAAVPSNAGLESGGWLDMQKQPHPMALRGGGSCKKWESKIIKQLDELISVILSEPGTWILKFPREGSSVQQNVLYSLMRWWISKTSHPVLGLWMTGMDRFLFP